MNSLCSERSLSPSDTELSSQELRSVCYNLHVTPEEDDAGEDEEQEISENGEEVLYLQAHLTAPTVRLCLVMLIFFLDRSPDFLIKFMV